MNAKPEHTDGANGDSAQVAEIVVRFEDAWERGQRPAIDDYVPADVGQRTSVLVWLVHVDLERRLKVAEPARVESYLERYPELAADPNLLVGLLATEFRLRRRQEPAVSVREYVDRFPQLGPGLTDRIAAGQPVSEIRERTGPTLPKLVLEGGRAPAVPGYDILGVLGHGGMGIVYRARHQALKRLVALKMIRAGAHAGPDERQRFRTEAEAAARLHHPNIVQIYEIGESAGQPYLSLEYLDGGSLADQLDGSPRPIPPSVQMIETLARAVHAAHQHGIVHRDLKPANILLSGVRSQESGVRQSDSGLTPDSCLLTPVPKVADFGLAKQLDEDLSQTRTGQIVGTPSYMAPEQANGRLQEIGPATDVYALGAMLYELLTGRVPLRGATALDTLELVRSQEPLSPSRLAPKLPRDLDTICLKCLEKDPRKRYPSAQELADDLGRFQRDEPIRARPASSVERLWRWCRRQPRLAAMSAALVLVIVGSMSGLTLLWLHAEEQRRLAEGQTRLAEGQTREANFQKQQADKNAREAKTKEKIGRDAVMEHFIRLTEDKLDAPSNWVEFREEQLRSALQYFQKFLKENQDNPELQKDVAEAHARIGVLLTTLRRPTEALKQLQQCRALREKMAANQPDDGQLQRRLAESIVNVGVALGQLGRRAEALAAFQQSQPIWEKLVKAHPNELDYHIGLARNFRQLGYGQRHLDQTDAARRSYQQALAIQQQLANEALAIFQRKGKEPSQSGTIHDELATTWFHIGTLQASTKQLAEAQRSLQQAAAHREQLVKTNPGVTRFKYELGNTCNELGLAYLNFNQPAEALRCYERGIEIRQMLLQTHPHQLDYWSLLGGTWNNKALALDRLGRHQEAREAYHQAIAKQRVAFDGAPDVSQHRRFLSNHYYGLARLERSLDKHAEAAQLTQQRQKLWAGDAVTKPDPVNLYQAACEFAMCLPLVGRGKIELSANEQAQQQGYATLALQALRQAVAAGFKDAKRLRTDKALEPLHTQPDFVKLLSELAATQ